MKFSTLVMVCGLVFTQQAFAQNNAKHQDSKTVVQTTTKTTVTTQKKANNESKAAVQKSKTTAHSSKASVKTPQKAQQKTVITTYKTTPKAVSGRSLILQTQQQLNRLGYKAGRADGLMGKNTREAIKRFQKQHNIRVDGKSTSALLALLKKANKK